MDIYKAGVCNELRQSLTAWEGIQDNPQAKTSKEVIERLRRKINKLCDILDALERLQ